MKIAVLSGKGGTGKTLVSVNLAACVENSIYIDCDVEEPNGHLFFKPERQEEHAVTVPVPSLKEELCTGCRVCSNFCKFNAIAYVKEKPLIFEEICHYCGGCVLLCPTKALTEKQKRIGTIRIGNSRDVTVLSGMLNIGEASGVPIIKKLLENESLKEKRTVFIDCPPGSACIVMESMRDADLCILVAEPTLFGVYNLKMVCELATVLGKPYGVILNKCLETENPAEVFCAENNIPIWGRIPFGNELGKINAEAKIAVREDETYRDLFATLFEQIIGKEAQR